LECYLSTISISFSHFVALDAFKYRPILNYVQTKREALQAIIGWCLATSYLTPQEIRHMQTLGTHKSLEIKILNRITINFFACSCKKYHV